MGNGACRETDVTSWSASRQAGQLSLARAAGRRRGCRGAGHVSGDGVLDHHLGAAAGSAADQLVKEDVAGFGSGVNFAAAAHAFGAGVDGVHVAAPEVQGAESGDDAQVARAAMP